MARKLWAEGRDITIDALVTLLGDQNSDHQADGLIKEMDKAGISQTVLLLPDFTYIMDTDLTIEDMISEHYEILERHRGRFYLFYGIDPRWGKDGLDVFERFVERHGLDGLKIYPPCGYSPSDESLYPFYEICQARGSPVLLHTGPTSPTLRHDFADPALIERAAYQFPGLNFILAHGAVNNTESSALIANYRDNVYIDTGGFLASMSDDGWQAQLKRMFSLGINHKILFGTDWPLFKMNGGQKKVMQKMLSEEGPLDGLVARDKDNIMRDNILRLMGQNYKSTE